MKKLLAISFFLFCTVTVFAQYNDSTFYRLNITTTGSINKTNDGRSFLLNNGLNFGIKRKDIVLSTANSFVYGNQNNTLTNRDFSSSLTFDLYKDVHKLYYWGLLNYNTSYSLKINNQFLGGLGVAYSFFDDKTSYLNLSEGILYDKSNLLTNLDYNTFRNSFRLSFRFSFNDVVIIDGSNFLQNSLSNANDYIIKSNTSVSLKLRKWISLTTAFNYNRMNITSRENLLLTYGLTLDKYF
ncbi:hypothetical protein GCM10027049_22310 [Mucilaginibacter puniceus]